MYFDNYNEKMKRIFLLGGYGFIGTNILKYIDRYYPNVYSVIVFDRLIQHHCDLQFDCVEKTYAGDFADTLFLKKVFSENVFDLVIHSLSTTVPSTSLNPRFDIESNLIPTLGLLDLLAKQEIPIVYISSGGAVYGSSGSIFCKHREDDLAFPQSSYGIVKLAIEKYLFQYHFLYGLKPLVVRLSNPYGPFHYSKKQGVINIALQSALKGEDFYVWGNGEARKDYIYVDDFCRILFLLIEREISVKVINIGSGEVLSLNRILEGIKDILPGFIWKYKEAHSLDVMHFELDITELRKIIGDFHFVSFQEGLKKTLAWLSQNENKYNG